MHLQGLLSHRPHAVLLCCRSDPLLGELAGNAIDVDVAAAALSASLLRHGTAIAAQSFEVTHTEEEWRKMFATNLDGVFHVFQVAADAVRVRTDTAKPDTPPKPATVDREVERQADREVRLQRRIHRHEHALGGLVERRVLGAELVAALGAVAAVGRRIDDELARRAGIDVRVAGSGNVGATNALRATTIAPARIFGVERQLERLWTCSAKDLARCWIRAARSSASATPTTEAP